MTQNLEMASQSEIYIIDEPIVKNLNGIDCQVRL